MSATTRKRLRVKDRVPRKRACRRENGNENRRENHDGDKKEETTPFSSESSGRVRACPYIQGGEEQNGGKGSAEGERQNLG